MIPTWEHYKKWLGASLLAPLPTHASPPKPNQWLTDTRDFVEDSWFVPLQGANFDGHLFIQSALDQGAKGFLYDHDNDYVLTQLPIQVRNRGIPVDDCLKALQRISLGVRCLYPKLPLIALTGSVGKTVTKEMIRCILTTKGNVLANKGNFNNEVGVPKTLLRLEPAHEMAVIEMGARRPGDIKQLVSLAKPTVALCLNAGVSHLGVFQSKEALLYTKLEIISASPDETHGVICGDDPRLVAGARASGKYWTSFGYHENNHVKITDVQWQEPERLKVCLRYQGESIRISPRLPHSCFAINAAAACAASIAAGFTLNDCLAPLESFAGIQGRFCTHQNLQGLILIDDAYNAAPSSMEAGLDTLARMYPNKRKIVILGDMLELGREEETFHRALGVKLPSIVDPSLLIAVGKRAKWIVDEAAAHGIDRESILAFSNVEAFFEKGIPLGDYGEVVYVKGSNGIGLSRIIDQAMT